jgi:hypothetical protein
LLLLATESTKENQKSKIKIQNCGIPAGRDAILIGPSTRLRIIKDDIIMTKKQDVKVWDFRRSGCVGHREQQGKSKIKD